MDLRLLMLVFLWYSVTAGYWKTEQLSDREENSMVQKATLKSCDSKVEIYDCDINNPITLRKIEKNLIKAKYTPDPKCTILDTMFDWTLRISNGTTIELEDYDNKDIFIIEPYTIGTGDHTLSLEVKEFVEEHDDISAAHQTGICKFKIVPELPIPKIKGGPEVTAGCGRDFVISGEGSVDMDVPPGQPGKLQFNWMCNVTGFATDFCKPNLGNKPTITIPWYVAICGSTYSVTLKVKTPDTGWQIAEQIVRFRGDIFPEFEIKCRKNCPPLVERTNSEESVVIEAVCIEFCQKLAKYSYLWYTDIPHFDHNKDGKISEDGRTFQINENILEPGRTYAIVFGMKGSEKKLPMEINVNSPPKLSSCSITPSSGEALKTMFTVNCHYYPGNFTFEIYGTQDNIDILLERGEKLEDLSFLLTAGSKVKVKMIDEYQFSDEAFLDVTVTSLLPTTGTEEDIEKEILNIYFNESSSFSITKLMKEKDFEKMFLVVNSLTDDIDDIKKAGKEEIAKKYFTEILDQVEKMPLTTETQARQISALAAKVTGAYDSKPDPDIAARGTMLCKKSADTMLNSLKKNKFPHSYSDKAKENIKSLSKCSQAIGGLNLDVLKPEVETPIITTPFPILDVPANDENYPDYVDDQKSSKAMSKFDQSAKNIMDVCYVCSKQLAVVLSTHDDTEFVLSRVFNVTSTLRLGRDISRTKIVSHQVTLVPSKDFSELKSPIHIAMCTSTENIFWWMRKEELFTSIAIIQFNVNERSVSKFEKPFVLTFETTGNIRTLIKWHEGTTPRTPSRQAYRIEQDFEKVSTHRIDVYKKQSFVIEFKDLPKNVTLQVCVTDLYKPSFEEFQEKATPIYKGNRKLFISNDKYYDSWYYLTVLPSSEVTGNSIQYKFGVYTLSCFRWAHQEAKWMFACASTRHSSTDVIICDCYRSSAMAAMLSNNRVRLEETLIEELELETQASYIIFGTVASIFLLYCVFFTWFSVMAADEVLDEPIYFLSDVPSFYRYGYVLIVKTGNKSQAGTTSNVSIKIYGRKSESEAHVLNYPDPEKKLLQKNEENWFFLATEFYLGDIEKIELWCDNIGYSPAWLCSEIEIFDIQQNKYWLFEINKWFQVLTNEKMTCTAFPIEPNHIKKKKVVASNFLKKFVNSLRGAHMWNLLSREEQTITRMKRLHIILSIFVTTYVMGIYLYGCPKLEASDSLSYTTDYGIDTHVVLSTLGCFTITFAIHFPIVWFFRYPKENIFGKSHQKALNVCQVSTNFLCWFFLILNIIVSMTLLIILGFWVPHVTGLLWLTSVTVSLVVYIFIMENIMRLIINFTTNQKTRVQWIFEKIKLSLATVEKQRAALYKAFGSTLLRPFFGHLYKPLDKLKLKEQRHWAEKKERLWEIVHDLIMITIYVVLLYLVILMDRDVTAHLSNVEVKDLIKGIHTRTNLLQQVLHRRELDDYINNTLITSMQSLQWYGKYIVKNPGMTKDNVNKYLGVARLRQHRTHVIPCDVDFINRTLCHPTYYWHPEYRNFSENWKSDNLSNRFSRMDTVWDYVSEAGTAQYLGTFSSYPGGGYISTLGRTMQNSMINVNYLFRNNWVDSLSRCLFIEFLLYNPCNNLFNSVRITFETYATGYMENRLEVHTARLLFIKEEISVMLWIILISFIIMLTILIVKLSYRIFRKRKLLLKDIWYIGDIFIILMSLACLVLYIVRSDVVRIFLADIENAKNNEFVNYFHLMYTERCLTMVAAVLVFLATLRLWKLMRFMMIIKVVEKTLMLSAPILLNLFLCQLVIIVACAFYAIVKYGDHDYDFRGVIHTLTTLFTASLNLNPEFDFKAISTTFGYIYYATFMLVMLGIYTIYIAVITICYAEAQLYYSTEEEYNIIDLLKEQYHYYKELIKIKWRNYRLRGGTDKNLLERRVFPKADDFRYADCITLPSSKMEGMSCVAKCVLRNMKARKKLGISNRDADLIKHTIVNLFRKDTEEKEIFFMGNIAGEKTKFVDDKVLLKMEKVVEAFLVPDDERSERDRRKKLCKKIVESHEQKMKDIVDNLNVLLNVIGSVKIS